MSWALVPALPPGHVGPWQGGSEDHGQPTSQVPFYGDACLLGSRSLTPAGKAAPHLRARRLWARAGRRRLRRQENEPAEVGSLGGAWVSAQPGPGGCCSPARNSISATEQVLGPWFLALLGSRVPSSPEAQGIAWRGRLETKPVPVSPAAGQVSWGLIRVNGSQEDDPSREEARQRCLGSPTHLGWATECVPGAGAVRPAPPCTARCSAELHPSACPLHGDSLLQGGAACLYID